MRNTIQTWLIVLGLTLLIGYPVAYFISMMVDNPRNQTILLLLAIIPFWTSFLIRVLAWRPMLGENGAINIVLQRLWHHRSAAEFPRSIRSSAPSSA